MESKYINCICRYKKAFHNNHTPMLIIESETGKIYDANLAACNFYGYEEELYYMNINDINVLTQDEIFMEMRNAMTENRKFFKFKHKLANNEVRDVEVYSGPMKIDNMDLLFSVVLDVKEKTQLEKDSKINRTYFLNLFNNSPEAIAIVDIDFNVLDINKNFKTIFQYDLSEIKNEDITGLLCEESLYSSSYYFREAIKNGELVQQETRRKRKDGTLVDVLLLGLPLVIEGEVIGAYCIYADISKNKEREKQIQFLNTKDSLTGEYNRNFFLETLEEKIYRNNSIGDSQKKLAVLVLTMNEYQEIKDALGYLVADEVLRRFTITLRQNIREIDIIARFSEDEFAILMTNLNSIKDVEKIVNRIIACFNTNYLIDNNELQVTTNIGISMYPDDGVDTITLVRKAYIALNKSKDLNINSAYKFENSLDSEVQEYFWKRINLPKAFKNGDLFLNYQPIYDTNTNTIIGVEALIRWNHRERGVIFPDEFIPVAEKTGLIQQIGEWVLLNACTQNRKWQDLGYEPIYISVNISVREFEKYNFYEMVKDILEKSKLNPKYLQIEITETFFTQNYDLISNTIKRLRAMGVKVAIDDFGTGYSSLEKLCDLDISSLKIDKSFIDGVMNSDSKRKIVKSVISLAESLNISLTAEGVETKEELDFLKDNRCNIAQGYLFSKPVCKGKIEELLPKYNK